MSKREKVMGICHICGNYGELSFEHVPPEKAFNNNRAFYIIMDDCIKTQGDNKKCKISQRGLGLYTLCNDCNNNTGSWYGSTLVELCKHGIEVLKRTRFNSISNYKYTYEYSTFPLKILKQIITMFFSVNNMNFHEKHPELVRFVLNKYETNLPSKYRFFIFHNIEGFLKQTGISIHHRLDSISKSENRIIASEIVFPPFGYVMTIDSDSPDESLHEVNILQNMAMMKKDAYI